MIRLIKGFASAILRLIEGEKVMERNKKQLIITMKEKEKIITQIKANIYSTSVDDLAIKAINRYKDDMKGMSCVYCGEETVITNDKRKKSHQKIGEDNHVIRILNYPIHVCPSCYSEFDDIDNSTGLNKLVWFEILKCLHKGEAIPSELDFKELMMMDG